MPEIKKSKIERIKELEKWNELFKFEMNFEDGSEGFMFKKSQDPMCSVGDVVQYTQNDKGTIKIIKEGSEKFVNRPSSTFNDQKDDDVIMMQCMFKASATYYYGQKDRSPKDVSETAIQWFHDAKNSLNKKEDDFQSSTKAPF